MATTIHSTPLSPPTSPPNPNALPTTTSTDDEVPYSAPFTDSLMTALLDPPPPPQLHQPGITVLPRNSTTPANPGSSIRLEDAPHEPPIPASDLPLALDDPRRIYASNIPNVKLTHPDGRIEGGAQPQPHAQFPPAPATTTTTIIQELETLPDADTNTDPASTSTTFLADLRAFAQSLIHQHNFTSAEALRAHLDAEQGRWVEQLRRAMEERREAIARNEKIEWEVRQMEDQRALERRVEEMSRRDNE